MADADKVCDNRCEFLKFPRSFEHRFAMQKVGVVIINNYSYYRDKGILFKEGDQWKLKTSRAVLDYNPLTSLLVHTEGDVDDAYVIDADVFESTYESIPKQPGVYRKKYLTEVFVLKPGIEVFVKSFEDENPRLAKAGDVVGVYSNGRVKIIDNFDENYKFVV